ncbi:MAG: phosphoglucosamine mutase [Deltaproteobacteria bacterium]|nr:phosphoglucosamine mutase [Deltaproteobacteria bacterium]
MTSDRPRDVPGGQRLFGTDGIRGIANQEPMTSETSLRLGRAIAHVVGDDGLGKPARGALGRRRTHRRRILVGKDTRLSGYMFETALASGICSMGADVLLVGPLPTPGVAFLTRSMRADAGVVISASHNPYQDNGIKFFSSDGFKLPDEWERRMEAMVWGGEHDGHRPVATEIGKAYRIDDALGRTIDFLKSTFPSHLTLEGLKIVVDCANGAGYRVAPEVLTELGAEVVPVAVEPDGTNINLDCGSVYPEKARAALREHGADLAVCLDGDADRALFIDEKGDLVDGDEILAMCAVELKRTGRLPTGTVVATVMSNMGLDVALRGHGIEVLRTAIGDRYVVEAMRRDGHNLGGEQSGHLVFLDHNTTGDGCLTALQVLALMTERERPLGELRRIMGKLPQVIVNVPVREKRPLSELAQVQARIAESEHLLDGRGRVLVRYSGTEPLARVMLEGESEDEIRRLAQGIADAIESNLGVPA